MTPQEKQEFEELKNEIELLKKGQNIEVASGMERLMSNVFLNVRNRSDVTDADVSKTISIPVGESSVNIEVLDFPDRWIFVYIDGKLHRLGAWLQEFDDDR